MSSASIIAICLAALGLLLIWRGAHHLLRHRALLHACSLCLLGLLPIATGALIMLIAAALQSYQLLNEEQLAAELAFSGKGEQTWLVRFTAADGRSGSFMLHGDDFRIEAQFTKWQLWTRLLDLQPYYRLERLSGRYQDHDEELSKPRSVVDLTRLSEDASALPLPELNQLAGWLPDWLPLLDARYGSAAYLPMRDGASYRIMVTSSGLIARAQQAPAEARRLQQ
ncbi:MAG: hypothetical protein Tsb0027_03640 [Wenzhouxiangellaceae bacterium]